MKKFLAYFVKDNEEIVELVIEDYQLTRAEAFLDAQRAAKMNNWEFVQLDEVKI